VDDSANALAERHSVAKVLTLDARHFGATRIARRALFKVLPSDR
jgi:predicted nucleic acid-binding protein